MIVKAGGNEKVVVVTSTQPCSTDQNQESGVFLLIASSQGRLASMVKGEVKLSIGVNTASICP
jgi:hypothetical protein